MIPSHCDFRVVRPRVVPDERLLVVLDAAQSLLVVLLIVPFSVLLVVFEARLFLSFSDDRCRTRCLRFSCESGQEERVLRERETIVFVHVIDEFL